MIPEISKDVVAEIHKNETIQLTLSVDRVSLLIATLSERLDQMSDTTLRKTMKHRHHISEADMEIIRAHRAELFELYYEIKKTYFSDKEKLLRHDPDGPSTETE